MKRVWSSEELQSHWVLTESELGYLKGRSDTGRLLFSILGLSEQRYTKSHRLMADLLRA